MAYLRCIREKVAIYSFVEGRKLRTDDTRTYLLAFPNWFVGRRLDPVKLMEKLLLTSAGFGLEDLMTSVKYPDFSNIFRIFPPVPFQEWEMKNGT